MILNHVCVCVCVCPYLIFIVLAPIFCSKNHHGQALFCFYPALFKKIIIIILITPEIYVSDIKRVGNLDLTCVCTTYKKWACHCSFMFPGVHL